MQNFEHFDVAHMRKQTNGVQIMMFKILLHKYGNTPRQCEGSSPHSVNQLNKTLTMHIDT